MKKTLKNQKGFTLIELMIVIAIIGILAAIAIPNFIAYRDKSFCSATESDANLIAGAIADYFSIPSNQTVSKESLQVDDGGKIYVRANLSNQNTWTAAEGGTPLNPSIEITVTDASLRCPQDYQNGMVADDFPTGYWRGGAGAGVYVKTMQN